MALYHERPAGDATMIKELLYIRLLRFYQKQSPSLNPSNGLAGGYFMSASVTCNINKRLSGTDRGCANGPTGLEMVENFFKLELADRTVFF